MVWSAQYWRGWSPGRDLPAVLTGRAQPSSLTASEDAGRIVGLVARHPFLTVDEVATLQGLSLGSVRRLCKRLRDTELVRTVAATEYPAGSGRADHLEATRTGLTAAAARDGLTLAQAVAREGFAGGGPDDPLGARSRLLATFAHTRGCAAFVLALVRAGQRDDDTAGRLLDWRNVVSAGCRYARPDAAITWQRAADGAIDRCWLEFDRGTERGDAVDRKLCAYAHEVADWGPDPLPNLLIVTTSSAAEDRLIAAADWFRVRSSTLTALVILSTTTARLSGHPAGPLGAIWRHTAGDAPLCTWPG
jgi:hypothetical protein